MTGTPILTTTVPLPQFNGEGTPTRLLPPRNNSTDLITAEDRSKYISLFQSLGPADGLLNGQTAKDVFVRSGLPPAKLQAIWELANTRKSVTLNQTEFIIAMHYIELTMRESAPLPLSLPASIYASATGRSISSPLARNNTLQTNRALMQSPVFKGSTLANVEITPEEYAKYKVFFNQLSTNNSGYVSGADAVVFFKHSKLPESDLAQIWDMADTNSTGQLTEQEFAKAMHMINRRLAGGDVPSSLPILGTQSEPQYQQQEPTVDLLGIASDFDSTFTPSQPHHLPPPEQQQQQQQQQQFTNLSRTQPILQSSLLNETSRLHQNQVQIQTELQTIEKLEKQVQQQKEELEQAKCVADEAEKQLELEKRKKEKLIAELQMYRQETKHFQNRAECAQNETNQIKKEIEELEKEKTSLSSPKNQVLSPNFDQQDVFALSSAGGLFAKVQDEPPSISSPGSVHSVPVQKTFDPFAGFKASQAQSLNGSPAITLNKLKESTEPKLGSTVDIGEIESKFPDLSTMEQNYATVASPIANQNIPETFSKEATSPKNEPAEKVKPKNESVSKYGFDLSAFESPSTTANSNNVFGLSVKDELSSIFGSPTVTNDTPAPSSGFDDIFGNPTKENNTGPSFEDAFFKKQ
ncbi:hypothetical protein G6F56_006513 [Rhizopus delemar]|nr:hypothetical protein G6F56_006513 [Rhizopus delemar]